MRDQRLLRLWAVVATLGLVFFAGRASVAHLPTAHAGGLDRDAAPVFSAPLSGASFAAESAFALERAPGAGDQGRQPPPLPGPFPQPGPQPGPSTGPSPGAGAAAPLVYETAGGSVSSANGFVAVTGSYGVGTSVLYVLDTENRQIAVYEARGGAAATRRLTFVGARRIDLDLQLEGYNDESEYKYDQLKELFDQSAKTTPAKRTTGANGASGRTRR